MPLRTLLVRAAAFLLIFAAFQVSWEMARGGRLEHVVIHDGIVRPAAALVRLITPDVAATAVQFAVKAPGGGLNIRNGCEGIEALFLLLAAFAVAPMTASQRVAGFLAGAVFVYGVNQLRILTLFYAWRRDPALFDLLHGTVTPIAVVLLVCTYFYACLAFSMRRAAASA